MKDIFDPKVSIGRKIKIALASAVTYMLWYPRLWIPCFCGGKITAAKPLKKHTRFVKQASKRLAREIFHKMMHYQKKLANKQNILNRFVDIGLDLFAISVACSYADNLAKKGEGKEHSAELADMFCCQAEDRIKINFWKIRHNHDRLSKAVAKKLLAGKYEWLENDIIKENL